MFLIKLIVKIFMICFMVYGEEAEGERRKIRKEVGVYKGHEKIAFKLHEIHAKHHCKNMMRLLCS